MSAYDDDNCDLVIAGMLAMDDQAEADRRLGAAVRRMRAGTGLLRCNDGTWTVEPQTLARAGCHATPEAALAEVRP